MRVFWQCQICECLNEFSLKICKLCGFPLGTKPTKQLQFRKETSERMYDSMILYEKRKRDRGVGNV